MKGSFYLLVTSARCPADIYQIWRTYPNIDETGRQFLEARMGAFEIMHF